MLVIGSFVGATEGKEYIDLELDLSLKQNPFGSEVLGRILLSGPFHIAASSICSWFVSVFTSRHDGPKNSSTNSNGRERMILGPPEILGFTF